MEKNVTLDSVITAVIEVSNAIRNIDWQIEEGCIPVLTGDDRYKAIAEEYISRHKGSSMPIIFNDCPYKEENEKVLKERRYKKYLELKEEFEPEKK